MKSCPEDGIFICVQRRDDIFGMGLGIVMIDAIGAREEEISPNSVGVIAFFQLSLDDESISEGDFGRFCKWGGCEQFISSLDLKFER